MSGLVPNSVTGIFLRNVAEGRGCLRGTPECALEAEHPAGAGLWAGCPGSTRQVPLWAWGQPFLPEALMPFGGQREESVYKNTDTHALHWRKL